MYMPFVSNHQQIQSKKEFHIMEKTFISTDLSLVRQRPERWSGHRRDCPPPPHRSLKHHYPVVINSNTIILNHHSAILRKSKREKLRRKEKKVRKLGTGTDTCVSWVNWLGENERTLHCVRDSLNSKGREMGENNCSYLYFFIGYCWSNTF